MRTVTEVESTWDFGLGSSILLLIPFALYFLGITRLWRRAGIGRGVTLQHAGLFILGWLLLAIALVSPLHELAEKMFAAHMVEHEILMAGAAPLLVLSQPFAALAWSVPVFSRRLANIPEPIAKAWHAMEIPTVATVLHAIAIWTWHIPFLFALAVEREGIHWLQHASFFGTALLFWWTMCRAPYGIGVAHLFITSMHTGLLGALLALSPGVNFAGGALGLTPKEDQQLGGLIMWVPGCAVYAIAALVLAGRWIDTSGQSRSGFAYKTSPHK
jgi:putative membrane protein